MEVRESSKMFIKAPKCKRGGGERGGSIDINIDGESNLGELKRKREE